MNDPCLICVHCQGIHWNCRYPMDRVPLSWATESDLRDTLGQAWHMKSYHLLFVLSCSTLIGAELCCLLWVKAYLKQYVHVQLFMNSFSVYSIQDVTVYFYMFTFICTDWVELQKRTGISEHYCWKPYIQIEWRCYEISNQILCEWSISETSRLKFRMHSCRMRKRIFIFSL